MRKSVTIGFGLWLLAVASVAVIAWIAINTAGHQVTAFTIGGSAAAPSISTSSSPVATPSVRAAPASGASSPRTAPAVPAKTGPDAETVRTYFGAISTPGGRVRAQCAQQIASLEGGGYARPEDGWEVRMLPAQQGQVAVFFGSKSQAIEVLAVCSDGRPAFSQQSQTVQDGRPSIPAPEVNQDQHRLPPVQPTAETLLGRAPIVSDPSSAPAAPSASGVPSEPAVPSMTASASQPASTTPASTTPASAAPLAQPGGAADPDRVAAYVQAQNDRCARGNWSSDWCHRWAALPDNERYQLVARWQTSQDNQGSATGRSGHPSDRAIRDSQASGYRYPMDPGYPATPAPTASPVSGSDVQATSGSVISPTSGS